MPLDEALKVVSEQAKDEGLWFVPETITENYLQRALRRLHAAIEGKSPTECAVTVIRNLVKERGDESH